MSAATDHPLGGTASSPPPRVSCHITTRPLDIQLAMDAVSDPSCGAIASFVGTTRNSFAGQRVLSLEYEAHEPMALRVMQTVADEAWERSGRALVGVFIAHRTGLVGVGEASIVIAASSPHRSEALDAVSFMLNRVKAIAPIWKREVYASGSSAWKENCECAWSSAASAAGQSGR